MKVKITPLDIQKTALRLPRELHTSILESASKSGRTMNAEIVHRLEQSFATENDLDSSESLAQKVREAKEEMKELVNSIGQANELIAYLKKDKN